MPGRKKRFACGHLVRGQYCRRCKQDERESQKQLEEQRVAEIAAREWERRIAEAPIELDGFPKPIAAKALAVIEVIKSGKAFSELDAKRMTASGARDLVRVKLGNRYRLILTEHNGIIKFIEVCSHEDYNKRWCG